MLHSFHQGVPTRRRSALRNRLWSLCSVLIAIVTAACHRSTLIEPADDQPIDHSREAVIFPSIDRRDSSAVVTLVYVTPHPSAQRLRLGVPGDAVAVTSIG